MESKTYKLKNAKGSEFSLTLEATEPGELPTDEALKAWHDRHGRPRLGACSIPGFANCQTPRQQITLAGRGGVAVPLALAKVGVGDYPPVDRVQRWYESVGFTTAKDCAIEGFAPCVLATF